MVKPVSESTNQAEIAPTLEQTLPQMAKDAARYRWLRDEHASEGRSWHVRKPSNEVAEIDLDAAIDAAMKG